VAEAISLAVGWVDHQPHRSPGGLASGC